MVKDDLFKNPFKTELYEIDGDEEAPTPIGFFGMRQRRRDGSGGRIVGTTSPKVHRQTPRLPDHIRTQEQADQWARENGTARPRRKVTVSDISTSHRGGGPLEEVRLRDWNGTLADTDRGGYYHPETGDWVPHKPATNGWIRQDSGMRPPRSPVNKSQRVPAHVVLDPQNAEIFRAKEEALRKKEEARELRRIETEQRNTLRARRIAKQEQELDNPTEPKPRGRPPKKKDSWW